MPRSYPIPGEILSAGEFFGLSYDQLLIIGFLPIIVMMFSFVVGFIPTWFSLLLGLITAIVVGVVVAKSPTGQDPFEWAGATVKRYFSPKTYTLQPTAGSREEPEIVDVVHTADAPGEFSEAVQEKISHQTQIDTDTTDTQPSVSQNN